jgi:uncharacterized protein YegP (UPF0339 family)
MRKLIVAMALIGGIFAAGVATNPTAIAQGKKDKDKGKSKVGTIEIKKGKDDKFRFSIRDAEGKFLASCGPKGYATEKDAKDAIDTLKKVLATAKVTTKDK